MNNKHLEKCFFFSITKYPKKTSQALHNITDIICDPRHISEFAYHGLLINQTKKLPYNLLVHSKKYGNHLLLPVTHIAHCIILLFYNYRDSLASPFFSASICKLVKKTPKFSCFISSTAGNPFGKLKKNVD